MKMKNIKEKGKNLWGKLGSGLSKTAFTTMMIAAPAFASGQEIVGNPNVQKSSTGQNLGVEQAIDLHGNTFYEVNDKGQKSNELWPVETTTKGYDAGEGSNKVYIGEGLGYEPVQAMKNGEEVNTVYLSDGSKCSTFAIRSEEAGKDGKRINSIGGRRVKGNLQAEIYTGEFNGEQHFFFYTNDSTQKTLSNSDANSDLNFTAVPVDEAKIIKSPDGSYKVESSEVYIFKLDKEDAKEKYLTSKEGEKSKLEKIADPSGYPFNTRKYNVQRETGQAMGYETGSEFDGSGSDFRINLNGKWAAAGDYNGFQGDLGFQVSLGEKDKWWVGPYASVNNYQRENSINHGVEDLNNPVRGTDNIRRDLTGDISRSIISKPKDFGNVPINEVGVSLEYDNGGRKGKENMGWGAALEIFYGQRQATETVNRDLTHTYENQSGQEINEVKINKTQEGKYDIDYAGSELSLYKSFGDFDIGLYGGVRASSRNGLSGISLQNGNIPANYTQNGQYPGLDNPTLYGGLEARVNLFQGDSQ
ncbi:MAG: hypothetical protein ABEI74_02290 [Candidatus Pacearchaeota archaeon]